jgi:hypothetical protein
VWISYSTFSSFHDIIFASLDFLVNSILRPNYFLTVSILDSYDDLNFSTPLYLFEGAATAVRAVYAMGLIE